MRGLVTGIIEDLLMEYSIRFKPAFASIVMTLQPGESIVAEPGAMTSMDSHLTMATSLDFTGILRAWLGGESLFLNTFKNPTNQARQIVLTPPTIGDIICVDIDQQGLCLQAGGFVACTPGVHIGLEWAGFSSWFSGEGLFRLKLSGQGKAFIGCFGGISEKKVPGAFIVDTGHLVAYDPSLKIKIQLAGGLLGSITSGEGFVMRLEGSGKIYLQSRSEDGLIRFLSPRCH